jgi:RNA polymerase sigma-70 factor (ECF subfamily)
MIDGDEAVKTNWLMANKTADPDYALIRAIAQGDGFAMDELYTRHGPGLLTYLSSRLGNRQWAEEVLQEVMFAVWQSAGRFRGESRVYTWMIIIARNRAINAFQRDKSLSDKPLEDETGAIPAQIDTDIELLAQLDELRIAVSQLPDEQRETLELVFIHGLSNHETAAVLNIPSGTVKSRLFRAKARLREWLEEKEIE